MNAVVRAGAGRRVPICVVMLNWNTCRHTIECLESLVAVDPAPAAMIVVENGSTDGSLGALSEWAVRTGVAHRIVPADPREWPPVRDLASEGLVVIPSATNRGPSGGNNLGMAYAAGDPTRRHILLLNNDTIVPPDYFAHLESALAARPDAGLMSGTVYAWAEPSRVWYAGGRFDWVRGTCLHLVDVPADATPVPTEYLPSCALLISPEVLATLGGLAECYYPFYFEDTEYAWRAGVAGFARLYAPQAAIYHKIGTSHWPPIRNRYLFARHNGYWARRNLHGFQRAVALSYLAITAMGRVVVRLLRGQTAMASAIARGTWAGLFDPIPRPQWPEPLPGVGERFSPRGAAAPVRVARRS